MKKRLKTVGVIVALLLIAYLSLRFGNPRIERPSPVVPGIRLPDFEVIAYNSHLLPPVANSLIGKRSDAGELCAKIAAPRSQFDLCGLAEVFDEQLAARMIDEMNADPSGLSKLNFRVVDFARNPFLSRET